MNADGHPQTLEASHPGNTSNLRHGGYSPRLREPRAREVAEAIMAEPHTAPIDTAGAVEIGRLETLIEALDKAIADVSMSSRSAKIEQLVEVRPRASRRLAEWLDSYGATPEGPGRVGAPARRGRELRRDAAAQAQGGRPVSLRPQDADALHAIVPSTDPEVTMSHNVLLTVALSFGAGALRQWGETPSECT